MNRTPPIDVRRELRREVGFGCPVDGCGNPYLYWHHFDPPWSDRQHHEPEGMIALCGEHPSRADAGAYTTEQLRRMKKRGDDRDGVAGHFDWLRHELLVVVGGNFYLEPSVAAQFRDTPVVSLTRDGEGHALACPLPITAVEVQMSVGSTEFQFGPREIRLPGAVGITGGLFRNRGAGLVIG